MSALAGRHIVLGVCGGIAAYKTAELVRAYRKAGAEVRVLMTREATRFVTPLTLGTLSENEVLVDVFPENEAGSWTKHVAIGLWADIMVVAPATAQTISKLANGVCDSMLTAVALSRRCPLLVCPAMDHDMYVHAATQANLDTLEGRGDHIMEAAFGALASGLIGQGRLPEPAEILTRTVSVLEHTRQSGEGPLAGKRVLVTAGPTQERLDPVRYISNHSSGTMGYAVAASAARRGADVVLVSGPTALEVPPGVRRVDVESTADMHAAVREHEDADVIVMVAAVADFTPADPARSKIKKTDETADLTLTLKPTVDILADVGSRKREGQMLIGFALETEDGPDNARRKLQRKRLDWIVLNNLADEGAGFGPGTNKVTILGADGSERALPVMPKAELADAIWLYTVIG
ncbi:MAG: bifunctional phosphopantothenoylcysteine decarboxylase/phosphopantothenate--cysteine ligase CoaBC [Rhodothermales bacterium]